MIHVNSIVLSTKISSNTSMFNRSQNVKYILFEFFISHYTCPELQCMYVAILMHVNYEYLVTHALLIIRIFMHNSMIPLLSSFVSN